ncbi:Polysialic acid transport protein KpsM [Roseimaritima multifibrata]|uniref:Polysialic acid transport protein KpsM n=1 Tax=Roseimaritima multifibrata TaxID=1930274 RepID=A0A517MNA5_9BACT|nr:ABC transporter permease [Roseimaritima multifibrata]QDS96361.1 Polysialic acid transport protein KpsM [Roseimaritima multifibrata]
MTEQPTSIEYTSQASELPVVVYSPESPLANPGKLVREVFGDLWRSRELIWILFQRDLKAQFRQSLLGYVWLFLPPVMTTAVWMFLNGQKVIEITDTGMPYPLFVIIGSTFWQTFIKLVQSPLVSFNAGKPVFMKLKVPPEAFIAAGTARAIFEFLIYAVTLIPVFFFFQVVPPWEIVFLPITILSLMVLGTACGLLLVPLGSLYGDIQQAVPVILGFLMYMAPVVYPPPSEGAASAVIAWNPVSPILMSAREQLVSGGMEHLRAMLAVLPCCCLVIFVCLLSLRVVMPHLVARMGM